MRSEKIFAVLALGLTLAVSDSSSAQDASTLPLQKSDPKPADTAALKPGANSYAESQVRNMLESKGYSHITTLVIDHEGIWRGAARKDDRPVEVSVDFQGHVAAK